MIDWKDALSSLRQEMDEEPVSKNVETENTEIDGSACIQKTPLVIISDKKGRNGKIATIIEGFTIPQQNVEDIARKIKQKLGVGGSVRNGEILIQGDHKNTVAKYLKDLNFKVK